MSNNLRWFFLQCYNKLLQTFSQDKKPFVYVSLGDSSVEGLGASSQERTYPGVIFHAIKETYPTAIWHNLGKHESKTSDVINTQLEKAISLQPDLVTLSVGANDIRFRTRRIRFERELSLLLKRLTSETRAEIVMNNIPDLSLTPRIPKNLKAYTKLQVWRFNKVIEKLAKNAEVILVDIFHQSRIYAIHYPEMIAPDGFHPTDFGYAIWANTILAHIQHIILKQNPFSNK